MSLRISHLTIRHKKKAVTEHKKADVTEHPKVFDHVGLLANEPPSTAGLLSI